MNFSKSLPTHKINILLFFLCISILIIVARLFTLQIYFSKAFFSRSQKNFIRVEKTIPERGSIMDINGKLLATNRPIHSIYWIGSGNTKFNKDKLSILKNIEKIINKKSGRK